MSFASCHFLSGSFAGKLGKLLFLSESFAGKFGELLFLKGGSIVKRSENHKLISLL